jgi:hypothetical protein
MLGFDCNCKLSYELAKKFYDDGYRFVMRYVGRKVQASFDLDKIETDDILKSGLQLGIVQHCPGKPGILPSQSLGKEYGKNAAFFAEQAGYQKCCIIYLDLEDVNIEYKKKQDEIVAFCNAFYDEVYIAGYTPGVYVGFNTFLSSTDLYHRLAFQHYWKSFSKVPDVYKRGYEMIQKEWKTVNGIQIDTDEVVGDNLGNKPIFMKAEEIDYKAKYEKLLNKIIELSKGE